MMLNTITKLEKKVNQLEKRESTGNLNAGYQDGWYEEEEDEEADVNYTKGKGVGKKGKAKGKGKDSWKAVQKPNNKWKQPPTKPCGKCVKGGRSPMGRAAWSHHESECNYVPPVKGAGKDKGKGKGKQQGYWNGKGWQSY